ncbi:MAG TPA: hypothetical protein PKH10_13005 [bacterium]|nr:hypothetical protein [bacterium]
MRTSLFALVCATLFVAACASDDADSDNENVPDDLVQTDHTGTVDDAITADDASAPTDDTVTPTDTDEVVTDNDIATDDIATDDIAIDDILTDETVDENDDADVVVTPDSDLDPEAAIACCVEIVKEWWRCAVEVYKTEQADACKTCVEGLAACTDFLPLDAEWACAASCNDICPPGTVYENDDTVGKGLGQSRRAVAEEYCTWMVDSACAYEPADFTGLGSTEPLEACF